MKEIDSAIDEFNKYLKEIDKKEKNEKGNDNN
jgi:hypothetical protein